MYHNIPKCLRKKRRQRHSNPTTTKGKPTSPRHLYSLITKVHIKDLSNTSIQLSTRTMWEKGSPTTSHQATTNTLPPKTKTKNTCHAPSHTTTTRWSPMYKVPRPLHPSHSQQQQVPNHYRLYTNKTTTRSTKRLSYLRPKPTTRRKWNTTIQKQLRQSTKQYPTTHSPRKWGRPIYTVRAVSVPPRTTKILEKRGHHKYYIIQALLSQVYVIMSKNLSLPNPATEPPRNPGGSLLSHKQYPRNTIR